MIKRHFEPGHPLVFLSDSSRGEAPNPDIIAPFVATESCIVIQCCSFNDGGTNFTIARANELQRDDSPRFDERLSIPLKDIILSTAEDEIIYETTWNEDFVRVRVWTKDEMWPSEVLIVLG